MTQRIITARVTDSAGEQNTDQVLVNVGEAAFTPPTVTITSPAAGATVAGIMSVAGTYTIDSRLTVSTLRARIGTGVLTPMTVNTTNRTWSGQLDTRNTGEGESNIVAEIVDSRAQSDTDTRTVNVSNVVSTTVRIASVGDLMCRGTNPGGRGSNVGADEVAALWNNTYSNQCEKIMLMGDLVYDWTYDGSERYSPNQANIGAWNQSYLATRDQHIPCPGNHESNLQGYYNWYAGLANQARYHHWLTNNGWMVISLNFYIDMNQGSAQYQWLQQVLAANPSRKIVAFMHPPRNTNCVDKMDERQEVRNNSNDAYSLLMQARCDLMMGGHAHSYWRYTNRLGVNDAPSASGIYNICNGMGGRNRDATPGQCSGTGFTPTSWPGIAVFDQAYGITILDLMSDRIVGTQRSAGGPGSGTVNSVRDSFTLMSIK